MFRFFETGDNDSGNVFTIFSIYPNTFKEKLQQYQKVADTCTVNFGLIVIFYAIQI